jgi:diguanylate cyclase (GGDEF)-like protein
MTRAALTRILYVEDEPDIQAIARLALEAVGGFTVEVCGSGEEAIRKAVSFEPDLILLDVMMPDMDGPSTLTALREIPAFAATPVMFMTAKVQPAEVAHFKSLGAIEVIAKPFDPTKLSQIVLDAWNHAQGGKTATLAERLAALRSDYIQQLPGKMLAIESAWHALVDIAWDETLLGDLHRMAHGLSGSGKTFGLEGVGDAARGLELQLRTVVAGMKPASGQERARLGMAIQQLRRVIDAVVQEAPVPSRTGDAAPAATHAATSEMGPVFLVENDADTASHLSMQLRHHGYDVRIPESLSGLEDAVRLHPPAVILMDGDLPDSDVAEMAARLRPILGGEVPVVFLSRSGELEARLRAVRAGGKAFFVKPIDVSALIDKLDSLVTPQARQPDRVLIIDDSEALAGYYAALLRNSGVVVEIETDPLQALVAIEKAVPDLILMDMYMPGCNGLELAAVIRQQPEYVAIAIVFLSTETDISQQLDALGLGADDFLTKPIEPEHLLRAVATRATRARTLRRYMLRDSLTGVLNHTAITERLESEIARARRTRSPLSFAILDIDHFKSVNDTYGHQMGDQVLREMARVLSVHMRASDGVGRLGGEEFAVILVDTEPAVAHSLLEDLRAGFSSNCFERDGHSFSVTFSCGIAGLGAGMTMADLIEAADTAMYEAKRSGRNLVVLAPGSGSGAPTAA